jgi:hypothetical protein
MLLLWVLLVEHLNARFDRCFGFPGAFGADRVRKGRRAIEGRLDEQSRRGSPDRRASLAKLDPSDQ